MQRTMALTATDMLNVNSKNNTHSASSEYDALVDIRSVKLRDGASRLENALYFLEQIKNPHKFKVGDDVVEICCAGEESLSDVLIRHFNRRA